MHIFSNDILDRKVLLKRFPSDFEEDDLFVTLDRSCYRVTICLLELCKKKK